MTSILLLTLDLVGTFAFAISGATAGVRKRLDLFGVLVLSFAAATAGGITRDALIGATPPAALAFGLGPSGAVLLGMVSGIGGGIARDLLVVEVPGVLRRELYAVAALLGASCVVIGHLLGWPAAPTAMAGALACIALRMLAIRRGWQLPVAGQDDHPPH